MTQRLPQCQNLQEQVETLLQLLQQEPSLRTQDTTAVRTSLRKATSPKFEIVFAGAFSAGKSMLINALLERKLLYSNEGHATATECRIEYAEAGKERVELTFLSEKEIREQVATLSQHLGLTTAININQSEYIEMLRRGCQAIIDREGGEDKSERAKQANALKLLLEGFVDQDNRPRIQTVGNAIYEMEQLNLSNIEEAAKYVCRGPNSAVLKKVKYYCNHDLLKDGNVIVDTPGIDAPVEKDAQLAYDKIQHPDTSAVVCVFKSAATGAVTSEETQLISVTHNSQSIRDRVFNVFNRIDETWFNDDLRRRLDNLINSQFRDTTRVYKTSGLLGFYGSQIKSTTERDRFGLDSIFADSTKIADGKESTPQFVDKFNQYCGKPEKVSPSKFPMNPSVFQATTSNEKYVRILSALGTPLIEHLILDSGIEEFRTAITRYLTEEKRPQLFANLADDLQPLCIGLKEYFLSIQRNLDSQPREIEAMKARELEQLNQELQQVGKEFCKHIAEEVNQAVTNACPNFEEDFRQLQSRMIQRLDELLHTFSVADAYSRATRSHPRNATAPLLAVLVEALYYLANQLEDVLVEASKAVASSFFQRLMERVRRSDYYSQVYRLLGNDGGIEQKLKVLENQVCDALVSAARTECDRYVRESPRFYDEGTFSIYQFRQTLQQTSQGYDAESMIEAQPAIRQLLKLDFEPKVSATIKRTFRQTINQTLKTLLLPMADEQADAILQKYNQARAYLEQTLETEAEEKIKSNRRLQDELEQKIEAYKQAIAGINSCLQAMLLDRHRLPPIEESHSTAIPVSVES